MKAYVFGAGASVNAGYPLASDLLHGLSAWLDRCDSSLHWVSSARDRLVQIRELCGSLDDFEGILEKLELEACGDQRFVPTGSTTNRQDPGILCTKLPGKFLSVDVDGTVESVQGFYTPNLRANLITAFREFFYHTEEVRTQPSAYDSFAEAKADPGSSIITFNYDIAVERALVKAGKWDIGNGYGFRYLPDRVASTVTVYKLHGSVNWFRHPMNDKAPPVVFSRDLRLLGYESLIDPRIGADGMVVDNAVTFILPDPRKKFYWESFWEPLWNAAAERLRAADEVFIHGYSMPTADARARQFLFDNIRKSAAISIHCQSRGDCIAAEFRKRGFTDVGSFPSVDFEVWAASEKPAAS